ncbi:MAG: hypothetical protein JWO15_3620 [Sphingomonadales bacterium]|nr:hypothetical protein [Sphingomonadales bacterium]
MDETLQKKYFEEFPEMLPDNFWFEVNDGWDKLLYKMFKRIQEHSHTVPGGAAVQMQQIKSKFGQLRVYWSTHSEAIPYDAIAEALNDIVHEAELEASKTCSTCGMRDDNKVLIQESAWHDPTCEACADKDPNG